MDPTNEWWQRPGAAEQLELCACPECGAPAEVVAEPWPNGGIDLVGVRCVARHWFFGLRDRLVA